MANVLAGAVMLVVFAVGSLFWLPGTLVGLARYAVTGESNGEGLLAWPYILSGRDDLISEFVVAILATAVGVIEWAVLLRWVASWIGT